MKKRTISILLAWCLTLTLLPAEALATEPDGAETEAFSAPVEASAESAEPETPGTPEAGADEPAEEAAEAQLYAERVSYAVDGGNIYFDPASGAIVDCDDSVTRADIPVQIGGVYVTSIGNHAFSGCSALTGMNIPNSVVSIGKSAFENCGALTGSITIPAGISSIGERTFYGCSKLTGITLPDSVTSIGNQAFYNCRSLAGITIPSGVTRIGDEAFYGCSGLAGSITIPNGITSIGKNTFRSCSSLTSITIPDSVTIIGDWAFSFCSNLTSITIPSSVTSIKDGAFNGCSSLLSIRLPGGIPSIGDRTFKDCVGLRDITIPDTVTSIGVEAFSGCIGLAGIIIPSGVASIGNSAFTDCHYLKSIIVPDSVTSMGTYVFHNCRELTRIVLPTGITSIGDGLFWNCHELASVTLPSGITSIGSSAFSNCYNLTSITIPDGVASIGNSAFSGCRTLTEIVLPRSITNIESFAFDSTALTDIYYYGTQEQWEDISVGSNNDALKSARLHYVSQVPSDGAPCGADLTWSLADGVLTVAGSGNMYDYTASSIAPWYRARDSIAAVYVSNGAASVGDFAFHDCGSLTDIAIPASVTRIGENAFDGCGVLAYVYYVGTEAQWKQISIGSGNENLKNAQIRFIGQTASAGGSCGEGLTWSLAGGMLTISGDGAMADYNAAPNTPWKDVKDDITAVRFTGRITHIGECAFYDCGSLLSIILPDSVTSIGDGAFHGCGRLPGIHIPNGVTRLGWSMFFGCGRLSSVNIPSGVTHIGAGAFFGCGELTRIDIPAGVTELQESAFYGCGKLKSAVIPSGLSQIGWGTFYDCASLETVTIPYSVKTIMDNAFSGCSKLWIVYYDRTRADWDEIEIGTGNDPLKKASIRCAEDGARHTVTFYPNGGVVNPTAQSAINGQPYGELPVPLRGGCLFTGWFTAPEGGTLITAETIVRLFDSQTLYAHWEAAPNQKELVVCEKYAGVYQANMNWNGNTFILALANSGTEAAFGEVTTWQAVYDEQGKMISVEKLLSTSAPQNGGISFSGTVSPGKNCWLYVLDRTYSPVIEKYPLSE